MAPKRKARQKARRRRRQRDHSDKYRTLVNKMKEKGLLEGRHKVIYEPRGRAKMSEVILSFAEPYLELANTYKELDKTISLAIVAWNTALIPESEQKAMVKKMINDLSFSGVDARDLIKVVGGMIKRKRRYFADHTRAVTEYHLSETRDGIHLSVASTL